MAAKDVNAVATTLAEAKTLKERQREADRQAREKAEGSASASASDATWTTATASRFESKAYSEYFDPCQEAAQKSYKCLHRNGGDREMCGDFFQAYRDCKEQWTNARKEARRKGSSWF